MVSIPPSTRLYSERAIWIATFLGSPLAGGILLRKNFICLQDERKGNIALGAALLFTVLLFGSLLVLPEEVVDKLPNQLIPLVYTVIMYQLARHYQGAAMEAHKAGGGEFYSGWNAAGIGALCLAGIFVVIFVYVFALPPTYDEDRYQLGMVEFSANEEEALTLYASIQNSEPQQVTSLLREKGIPAWKNNIRIIQELDDLEHLPDTLRHQNQLLRSYCQLRLEAYELMVKAQQEGTDKYEAQIEARNADIEAILNKLQE
jgi:hypothetical protein